MSENQNMFADEYDRLDDISKKEEILKEAKEIPADADYKDVMPTISALQKKWRRIGEGESAYEESLRKQFDEVLDVFYAKQKEALKDVVTAKEELIKKAEALVDSKDLNKATNEINALFDEWKKLGYTDKKTDDELWAKFNTARQSFYDNRHELREQMAAKMQDAVKVKEELITKAEELADSTSWKKTTKAMDALMEEWKAAGYAGKEHNDELWDKFRAARKKFYDARSDFYAKQNAEFAEKVKSKQELIEKAKAIVEQNAYSRENSDKLKELSAAWKEVGFSGRDKEEKLWNEFKGTLDTYYAGLKAFNEQKHTDWLNRMESVKSRKVDMIEKQKKQLTWMERELTSVIGEAAFEEMQLDIEDKKAFIEQLEAELKELEDKIAK
ncbi:MAG: DUF349 domain-containing protein [Erysipelotrichaceae bacterium]|nr:DUF349 domain-containing protein [Erysipelotrichaceae bacterium]